LLPVSAQLRARTRHLAITRTRYRMHAVPVDAYPYRSKAHAGNEVTNLVTVCGDWGMTGLAELVREAAPDPGGTPIRGIDGGTVEHTTDQTITSLWGGGEYVRVTVRGHVDHDAVQRLRTHLGAVLDAGARYLTVDFSDVTYCDGNVLDVLDWAAHRASLQQGWLSLTGVHRRIRMALR